MLGRGGAGFPAGVKWGLTPQGVWPRYLVVNGDESEPGTYKDRLLMERDPHQLIEGCLIACYAAGLSQCFLYIRGEMALAQERVATALNEAYAAGYVGTNILGTDFSVDIVLHVGRRRLRGRRGDGAHREPRGQPRHAPAEAAVLPGGHRPVRPADDRQQRRDARQPAVAAAQRRRRVHDDRHRDVARHPHGRGVRPRQAARRVRDRQRHDDVPRPALRRGVLRGIRDGNELKAFVPGGGSAPWFTPEQLDLPFEGKLVGAAGSMLGSGAIMVMDETTDIPEAALTLARFYAHESCGKCVPCREGGTWLERILARVVERPRRARATSTCCSRSASRSAPGASRTRRATRARPRRPCRSRTR